jgi:Leucine-rich repeat (LRR) protein
MYHWVVAIDTKFEWQIESNLHTDKTSSSWIVSMWNQWIEWNNLQLDITSNSFVIKQFWTESTSILNDKVNISSSSLIQRYKDTEWHTDLSCMSTSFKCWNWIGQNNLKHFHHKSLNSHHFNISHFSKITSLPTQIGLLTQLHTLDLFCCSDLTNIPTELEYLTNLREFRLSGTTKINTFPLKMKNRIKLEVLELNSLNIEMIPSEVWMMTKLRHLSLYDNKLSFIPSELSCLSNLTHLNLSSNQITHLSNQINKLTQLQYLNLSCNRLTEFPDDISSLLHLSGLWIYNNKLNQFPSQLPPNLVRLNLNWNLITSIPSTILFSLTRLEILDLSNNQITILPTQIGLLTSLQELCLNNNKLSFIPSDLVSEQNHCRKYFYFPKLFFFVGCFRTSFQTLHVWTSLIIIWNTFLSRHFRKFAKFGIPRIHSNFLQWEFIIGKNFIDSVLIYTTSNILWDWMKPFNCPLFWKE